VLTGDHGMTSWNQSLLPAVLTQITEAGFTPEIVTPGQGPAAPCDVVIVPNSVRTGAFSLRGAADTPGARDRLVATLEAMPQIDRVIGPDELPALHASSDEGDVIAEAAVPFGFGQSPPPGQWRGSHGSLAERHVPLLPAGAGIRPGAVPHRPRLVDLAHTSPPCSASKHPARAKDGRCARPSSTRGRRQDKRARCRRSPDRRPVRADMNARDAGAGALQGLPALHACRGRSALPPPG
jgi:hypothetical protein